MLVHVAHVVKVKGPGAGGGIVGLHGTAHGLVAGQVYPEAALHPKQGLDDPVDVVDIRLTQRLRSVNAGAVHGHLAAAALHRHVKRLVSVTQKRLVKTAQGDERRIQRGKMFDGHVNAKMLHDKDPPSIDISVYRCGTSRIAAGDVRIQV